MLYERRQSLLLSQGGFKQLLSQILTDTCANWHKNFSFTHFLLIKGYRKYSLRKESVIASFVD